MKRFLWGCLWLCVGCARGKNAPLPIEEPGEPPLIGAGAGAGGAGAETPTAATAAGNGSWFIDTDPVFDDATLHTFHVTITDEDQAWLDENATLEEYVPAELTFDDTPMGEVGIRYKGASSLHHCYDEDGMRIETDHCAKLSYKIKFDEYVDSTRLYGLKRINLHAMQSDYSKLKERLGYKLFRAMGVHASRSSHARVMINGEYQGLFAMVEAVDGRFTEDRWPDQGDGNLYKEMWWTRTWEEDWVEGLETNRNVPDVSEAMDLVEAIGQVDAETFLAEVAPRFDIDHFIRYMAVDRAISNVDGITRFYATDETTDETDCYNKNFYVYQQEAGGLFLLIPWDMDLTFGYPDEFMDIAGLPNWNVFPADCRLNLPVWEGDSYAKPPGCDRFLSLVASNYWDEFVVAGTRFLRDVFRLDTMIGDLDRWEAQITPSVEEDPNINYDDWRWGINELRSDLPLLITRYKEYLQEDLVIE